MFSPTSLEDLSLLRETVELECKLAQGQHGQGEVPKDFWPTYSAMANAHGGVVLLGVREKDGVFSIAGIANPAKVRADLFNNLNNPGKVSANLLTDADVEELALQGQTMLLVRIPQATRKQRPVFSGPLLPAEGIASTIDSADSLPGRLPVGGSEHSQLSSEHSQPSSEYSKARQDLRDAEGRLLSPLLDGPVLDDLGVLAPGFLAQLQALAAPARSGRLGMDQMQAVICAVCEGHYVTRAVLARLLDRSPDALRQTHISPMVRSGMLQLAFPSKPTHEQQAYKTGKL